MRFHNRKSTKSTPSTNHLKLMHLTRSARSLSCWSAGGVWIRFEIDESLSSTPLSANSIKFADLKPRDSTDSTLIESAPSAACCGGLFETAPKFESILKPICLFHGEIHSQQRIFQHFVVEKPQFSKQHNFLPRSYLATEILDTKVMSFCTSTPTLHCFYKFVFTKCNHLTLINCPFSAVFIYNIIGIL